MKKKTINKFKKDSLFLSQSVLIPKVSIGYNNWACAITEYQYRVAALTIYEIHFFRLPTLTVAKFQETVNNPSQYILKQKDGKELRICTVDQTIPNTFTKQVGEWTYNQNINDLS